jgi:hypothetical protein
MKILPNIKTSIFYIAGIFYAQLILQQYHTYIYIWKPHQTRLNYSDNTWNQYWLLVSKTAVRTSKQEDSHIQSQLKLLNWRLIYELIFLYNHHHKIIGHIFSLVTFYFQRNTSLKIITASVHIDRFIFRNLWQILWNTVRALRHWLSHQIFSI